MQRSRPISQAVSAVSAANMAPSPMSLTTRPPPVATVSPSRPSKRRTSDASAAPDKVGEADRQVPTRDGAAAAARPGARGLGDEVLAGDRREGREERREVLARG